MLTSERKAMIARKLGAEGRLVAKELAIELGLSEDTIRRDLREMAAEGLLARVHGGALPVAPPLPNYQSRIQASTQEKDELAKAAVNIIEPGQVVYLDGGSTNLALVRALPLTRPVTIITHSPTIASALEHHENAEIMLIGGRIYRHSMVAIGVMATQAISQLRADLFFLGVTGVHPQCGLTTGDMEEAAIKRQIAAQSRHVWVMATAEKLGAASPFTVLPLEAATGVIIPSGFPAETTSFLSEAGLTVMNGLPSGQD